MDDAEYERQWEEGIRKLNFARWILILLCCAFFVYLVVNYSKRVPEALQDDPSVEIVNDNAEWR